MTRKISWCLEGQDQFLVQRYKEAFGCKRWNENEIGIIRDPKSRLEESQLWTGTKAKRALIAQYQCRNGESGSLQ